MRADSHAPVVDWARAQGATLLGTDEHGDHLLPGHDLSGRTVVVVGNETRGMTAAWRHACDATLSIPMGGSASSLNAASAGTVVLYEAARSR